MLVEYLTLTKYKKELQEQLSEVLKGAQRVPTLLLQNPQQAPSEINLQHYSVLECEPLHDLKGHLKNLFEILPEILDKKISLEVSEVLELDLSKEKKTGADYRLAAMHLLALLRRTVHQHIVKLLETIVTVSEILYATDDKRSPRQILRLYNSTWLHHELCNDLFPNPKSIPRTKLFASYLHALSNHAAQQYEIICMRSTNTEHEERLFGQAKKTALNATESQTQSFQIFFYVYKPNKLNVTCTPHCKLPKHEFKRRLNNLVSLKILQLRRTSLLLEYLVGKLICKDCHDI